MAYVKPEAIVIGVAAAIAAAYLFTRNSNKCSELDGIWSETGPIFLTEEAQSDALEFMGSRLTAIKIGGGSINAATLALETAIYLAPDCDWPETINLSKKTSDVWISLVAVAEYAIANGGSN